jgi:hypothetical protein
MATPPGCLNFDIMNLPDSETGIECGVAQLPDPGTIILPSVPATGADTSDTGCSVPVNRAPCLFPIYNPQATGFYGKLEQPNFNGLINQWHTLQDIFTTGVGYRSTGNFSIGGYGSLGLLNYSGWCDNASNFPMLGFGSHLTYYYLPGNAVTPEFEDAFVQLNWMNIAAGGVCGLYASGAGVSYRIWNGSGYRSGHATVTDLHVAVTCPPADFRIEITGTLATPPFSDVPLTFATQQSAGPTGILYERLDPLTNYHGAFFDCALCPKNVISGSFRYIVQKGAP